MFLIYFLLNSTICILFKIPEYTYFSRHWCTMFFFVSFLLLISMLYEHSKVHSRLSFLCARNSWNNLLNLSEARALMDITYDELLVSLKANYTNMLITSSAPILIKHLFLNNVTTMRFPTTFKVFFSNFSHLCLKYYYCYFEYFLFSLFT